MKWKGNNGVYTTKEGYSWLIDGIVTVSKQRMGLWKLNIPNRIKIFMWIMCHGKTLTRDSLLPRGWKGDERCSFCDKKRVYRSPLL